MHRIFYWTERNVAQMENQKKVCFACIVPCNLFVSYILSKTVYKDDYKVLILSDHHFKKTYSNIMNNCKVWDEVILIKESRQPYNHIRSQLTNIDFKDIDILHYFSFAQNSYNFVLLDYIPEHTKIIQTVFSMATYYIKEYYLYFKRLVPSANVDMERIAEIWVYDKELYIGEMLKRPIKNIEIIKYMKDLVLLNEFCKELNMIFDYEHNPIDFDVLFLDQPVSEKYISPHTEKGLFIKLLNELEGKKVVVKHHPRSSPHKYKGLDVECLKSYDAPWEVVLMNEIKHNPSNLNNKIVASYFSDALMVTHLLLTKLDIPITTLRLKGILQRITPIKIGDGLYEKFIGRFKEVYSDNFYDIQSLDELKKTLPH